MKQRKKYTAEFKGQVALAAIRGQKTMVELCKTYSLHESMIQKWKCQAANNISMVFGVKTTTYNNQEILELHAKIGELLVERDFLKKACKV